LSIIYATFTVLNFIAPALIKLLGTRSALVFGGSAYVLFLAGFLHVNQWFLYASSVLLGLGAAIIWTAQGKYLTLNSNENNAAKHSSLFLALSQAWCFILPIKSFNYFCLTVIAFLVAVSFYWSFSYPLPPPMNPNPSKLLRHSHPPPFSSFIPLLRALPCLVF
jgi:MFS family permease